MKSMEMHPVPATEEALQTRIEERMAWYKAHIGHSVIGMIGARCLGGSTAPLRLEFSYATQDWMKNPIGTTHGGMLATMFDNAMGMTAFILSPTGGTTPTAELRVSYLLPVPIGAAIRIRVYAEHVSSRMIRMRAEMRLEGDEDRLYATGSAINCPMRVHQGEET